MRVSTLVPDQTTHRVLICWSCQGGNLSGNPVGVTGPAGMGQAGRRTRPTCGDAQVITSRTDRVLLLIR